MKYLCLFYHEEAKISAIPDVDFDAHIAAVLAHRAELETSGHYIACDALQFVESATTLRVRNGKMAITDGPFVETKEQLGGFYLIEAKDLNEAIRIASKMPPARPGSIEVRPIRELSATASAVEAVQTSPRARITTKSLHGSWRGSQLARLGAPATHKQRG